MARSKFRYQVAADTTPVADNDAATTNSNSATTKSNAAAATSNDYAVYQQAGRSSDITIVAPPNVIEYEDGVARGKEIVAQLDAHWWAICEIAARLKPKYGAETRKRYFIDIGIGSVGERRLSVYDAWREIFASWDADEIQFRPPGPKSVPFTVLRELQAHPNRAKFLKENPQMQKAEAADIMRAHRKTLKKDLTWRQKELKKQFSELESAAKTVIRLEVKLVKTAADFRLMQQFLNERPIFLATLRDASDALHRSLDVSEHLDELIAQVEGNNKEDATAEAARNRDLLRAQLAEARFADDSHGGDDDHDLDDDDGHVADDDEDIDDADDSHVDDGATDDSHDVDNSKPDDAAASKEMVSVSEDCDGIPDFLRRTDDDADGDDDNQADNDAALQETVR